jgi:threonine aldolase
MINLYSDTQTLPTQEMFEAAASAPLGDDVLGTDPTTNRLQEMAAEMLGMEAGLFVPTGTMANLVALMVHASQGDEVLLAEDSHTYYYEAGNLASVAGLMPRVLPARPDFMEPDELEEAIRPPDPHFPTPRVVALENAHNLGGGTVMPPERHRALCDVAHAHGLKVHLDGARIFNASVALNRDPRELVRGADTMMFCLSKGLSCPAGSVLLGSREAIACARRIRKRLGGTMRQSGVLAAMGIVALEKMVGRLAEDHANTRRLAQGLLRLDAFDLDMRRVQTNMVYCRVRGMERDTFLQRLRQEGVLASDEPRQQIRFVTHRHISAADVDEVLRIVRKVVESGG